MGENWGFSGFFLTLGVNPCFWVKNGGKYVNMRSRGNVGKIETSKNAGKLGKIGINFNKFGNFSFFGKNS